MPQQGGQQIGGRPGGNGFTGQSGQGAVMGPQRPRGEHLDQWMQQHQNMSPQQQQRALQKEPGFNQLPQQTQQRMMERLNRLNSMPAPQREKIIQRGEAMERLSKDCDILSAQPFEDLTTPKARAILHETEILVTGWGSPFISRDIVSAAPQLKLIAHAAGLAAGTGCRGTSIIVADSNHGARRLYQRTGHVERARRAAVKEDWHGAVREWVLLVRP